MSQPLAETERFNAFDSLRATAMLLGVVYHSLLFRMFAGGGPPGMGPGMGGPARYVQDWLHSFRMPLFFLISGFFARMMFQKYGVWSYLTKRWYRIGLCLVIGMFTFGPIYVLTREAISSGPGGGPGPGRGGFGRPGGGGGPGLNGAPGAAVAKADNAPAADDDQDQNFPKPPDGFIPPPLADFDKDGDGSFSDAEWKEARAELRKMFGAGGPPGFGPGGPPPPGMGGGPPGMGGPPGGGPPRFGPGGPFGGGPGYSALIFGNSSRLFQLNHLWFLWYLLIFITVAPLTAKLVGMAVVGSVERFVDRVGVRAIRSGLLAPLLMGLITTPPLMLSSGPFGWSLGMPGSIFRAFPDFLIQPDPEMVFYFVVFLFGWWLHRERIALPQLARAWLPNLLLGIVAFAGSVWLSDAFGNRFQHPYYAWIRALGYGLYALSSASTAFGLIGLYERYLGHPTKTGRYLADTALWVYLVHQPLVLIGLHWFVPMGWPWYVLTLAVSLFAASLSLVLYEAIVRPTCLVKLFGPASPRPAAPKPEGPADRLALELNMS